MKKILREDKKTFENPAIYTDDFHTVSDFLSLNK